MTKRNFHTDTHAKRAAFTLVELLVVISIIGLLSTVAVVGLGRSRDKSRFTKAQADMSVIGKAVDMAYNDNGVYPADASMNSLPAALASYLSRWPQPPCSGWVYDYENWTQGSSNFIRTSLRRAGDYHVISYIQPLSATLGIQRFRRC
jgi:prepilin-type N-terminal cleavage/methylation domain-containing protein